MIQSFLGLMNKCQGLPLLLARLMLGYVFMSAGLSKFQKMDRMVEYFGSIGIWQPQIQAPFVAAVEVIGGMLLLAGFLTRYAAIPLAVVMAVALWFAHGPNIKTLSNFVANTDTGYLLLLIFLVVNGGGWLSLDRFLWKDPFGENRQKKGVTGFSP